MREKQPCEVLRLAQAVEVRCLRCGKRATCEGTGDAAVRRAFGRIEGFCEEMPRPFHVSAAVVAPKEKGGWQWCSGSEGETK